MSETMRASRVALAAVVAGLVAAACGAASGGGEVSGAERSSGAPVAGAATTSAWRPLHHAILSRSEVGAARIGRFIYVVGGFLPSGETTAAVERYDIKRNSWRVLAPMPVAVNHPAATSYRGKLYVYGGYTDSTFGPVTGTLQRFDPASGSWVQLGGSVHPRAAAALAAINGKLFAVGGAAGGAALDDLEIFDLRTGKWRPGSSMRVAREHIAATVAGGDLYVFGGRSPNVDTVERFRPGSGWRTMPPLRTPRSGIAAATVHGKPVVFGGEEITPGGSTIRPVELFDPDPGRWHRLPGMRTPRHGLGGAAKGRRVYALEGGPQPGFEFSGTIEFLDIPRRLLR
jgi:N-acetylneuraminic acid mutarotase